MKHLKLISMFILGGLVLTGCAVKSPTTAMLEHKEKKVNQTIVEVPKWYKKLPNKKDIIFTAGAATAPDLQLSVDIATMNAKTVLADRINGKLDSMTKQFIAKTGTTDLDSQVLNELERVSKNVIASVDVAGYKIKDMEVYPAGTQYRSFVLLEYSDEEAIKILMNRMRKDRAVYAKLRSKNAFQELERSVDKSLDQDEVQSLSNIEKEIDDLGNNRYIKTVPSVGPDNWMTE